MLVAPSVAWAQLTPDQQRVQMFQEVMQGRRSLQSLSPSDHRLYLQFASLMAPRCPARGEQCEAICDAAAELQSAAEDLAQCARRLDMSNDCSRQFRNVRSAHSDYESAVSDGDGQCD